MTYIFEVSCTFEFIREPPSPGLITDHSFQNELFKTHSFGASQRSIVRTRLPFSLNTTKGITENLQWEHTNDMSVPY